MKERSVGLDIARILAMFGIVTLHILGSGGILSSLTNRNAKFWFTWWIEICMYCSVDLFALLSGYLGINKKKYSVYRTLELISVVLMYSIIITICFLILCPDVISGKRDIIEGILPILDGRYWYITCYIPVAILQPYINKMLNTLSINEHKKLCILSIVIFSVLPNILRVDMFAFKEGYSFVWMLICYILGAYLKRRNYIDNKNNLKKKTLILFICSSIILLGSNILIYMFVKKETMILVTYVSPFILWMSVLVLIFFANVNITKGKNIIMMISGLTFDVYIVHCHIYVFDRLIKGKFTWISQYNTLYETVYLVGCVTIIFILGILIGKIRTVLYNITGFSKMLKKVANKIDNIIYVCDNGKVEYIK